MCGIIGHSGEGLAKVEAGLKSLEYRGYDSWGVAWNDNDKIRIRKQTGKISEADSLSGSSQYSIGHTRWATHGSVTNENAHPHSSERVAIVHNGIIENHESLRKDLVKKGHIFSSETDSETIPHLIERFLDTNEPQEAFRQAMMLLEGSFAVVAMIEGYDAILFARKGSPLILGIGEEEHFVASDIPAFLDHTDKIVLVDDGQYGLINGKWELRDIETDTLIERQPEKTTVKKEAVKKGKYPHFMLKEMHEQPKTIRTAGEQDTGRLENAIDLISQKEEIVLMGSGSSYHACIAGSQIITKLTGKRTFPLLASECETNLSLLTRKAAVIAISQSGETADLLDAVVLAKKRGSPLIAITNSQASSLVRAVDEYLLLNAGPEICVLSTKSYTSQLSALFILAMRMSGRDGKTELRHASLASERVLAWCEKNLPPIAKKIAQKDSLFVIGRGNAHPTALEGALKIKEASYIHAEGFAGGELKHGTISLIEKGTPLISVATQGTRTLTISNAMEVKSRGGLIIGIDSKPSPVYDIHIPVASVGILDPVVQALPFQYLAYLLALERGHDPDKPRNLAKSVTVR
ncbi:glutamine--fructose-6-phosphate transaminase (isomerizing) [Candidatus Woesearchaeota archaeon]|nr:glutamine--fructose-6-phosphate transaminase (isomerizing) [Candidatus Woesearchaeota archaeon]